MKVLITGAKGQLGQDCTRILEPDHTVHPFGSQDLDIANFEQVMDCFQALKPDCLINCAAYTAVDKCETEKESCWRVNGEGAGTIAAACAKHSARLIHISTDYVFDGAKPVPEPYTESEPVNPLSEYGASKLEGEEQIRATHDDHVILRTSWLYGIGAPNFLKTMLRLAVSNPDRVIKVVNDQFGSLTWTHRLALQIQTLLKNEITGTFHATAEGHGTWYEGAKLFLETMHIPFSLEPCTTEEYPTPAKRPQNSILENSRLKDHGLNKMVSWEEDVVRFAHQFHSELLAGATS